MTTPIISVAGATQRGSKVENQDTFFITKTGAGAYLGVFDGHGEFGTAVAEAAADSLRAAGPAAADQLTCADAFAAADAASQAAIFNAARLKYGQDCDPRREPDGMLTRWAGCSKITRTPLRGGTTGSAVSLDVATLQLKVAHVGDSEVLVVHESGFSELATKDHSTTSLEEFARLREDARAAPGGRVPLVEFHTGGYAPWGTAPRPTFVLGPDGNYQLNPQGGYYYSNVRKEWASYLYRDTARTEALAFTRSFGDNALKCVGVTARPDWVPFRLNPSGRSWVITASDGLYDNFTYEELATLVRQLGTAGLDAAAIVRRVMEVNRQRGIKNFGPSGLDDTTVCVIAVDPEPSVSLRLRLEGGATLCQRLSPAAALRLAVGGKGLGLTLCGGVLSMSADAAPLSWESARLFAKLAAAC